MTEFCNVKSALPIIDICSGKLYITILTNLSKHSYYGPRPSWQFREYLWREAAAKEEVKGEKQSHLRSAVLGK